MPSLRAVGGPCIEVSLGTWEADPVLYQHFAIQNRNVPSETSRRRPRKALKLGGEDSQLSRAYTLHVLS